MCIAILPPGLTAEYGNGAAITVMRLAPHTWRAMRHAVDSHCVVKVVLVPRNRSRSLSFSSNRKERTKNDYENENDRE
jgi:hypothetical protein